MAKRSNIECSNDIKKLTVKIQKSFSSEVDEENIKWSLLKTYYCEFLQSTEFDKNVMVSYKAVLSTLLDALQPTLFPKRWQETLYDEIFLQGILHESFLLLAKQLDGSKDYEQKKIINLLVKMCQSSSLQALFLYQCQSCKCWDLKYVSQSGIWDDIITALISLPERIANKTEGKITKMFNVKSYRSLLASSVLKVLGIIYERLKNSQDCSVEFLANLTGRICLIGSADIVAKQFLKEYVSVLETDYLWRRILQNFISKMPSNSLDSFITCLLRIIPWYGYVEWILGDMGFKNQKINYIMTVKLLFFQTFKHAIILQNIIGYFASSSHRLSHFIKVIDSLLDSWVDEKALKHQSTDQKLYISLALMICVGWLKKTEIDLKNKDYIMKVLKGTQFRLGSSEEAVRSMGMIVGEHLINTLDSNAPPLKYEFADDKLVDYLKSMLKIPSKPVDDLISIGDIECFEESDSQNEKKNTSKEKVDSEVNSVNEELDSDDDLEPYDMSCDIPQSKRPLYLRECLMGMVDHKDIDWTEQCMKYAEELIKANSYAAEEIAEEMAKILLHCTDVPGISDYVALRHRILIALTVQCPLVVSSFLASEFTEREFTIRQRLDILEVLAASSALLSSSYFSLPASKTPSLSSNESFLTKEASWKLIINERLETKTKRYAKAPTLTYKENKFSAIAGNFFYPLLNTYEKACKILKLDEDDSYVLGRFVYTLGIIMSSASNTLHCVQMATTLLQFLSTIRSHKDVFVRQAIIFAVAATYTAVPSSFLFKDMLQESSDTAEWLQSVAQNDPDSNCLEKALYALSIYQNAAAEEPEKMLTKPIAFY